MFEGKKADRFLERANMPLEQFVSEVDRISILLNVNEVSFLSGDFMDLVSSATSDDFVALNPPYPENEHSTLEKEGMYVELYSPEQLHQNLIETIKKFERQTIHYYMTYGFYNGQFQDYVLRNEHQQPINYFRVLGFDGLAIINVILYFLWLDQQFKLKGWVTDFFVNPYRSCMR